MIRNFIIAAVASLVMPLAAHASPVTIFDQGLDSNGNPVAANRSDVTTINDGDASTFVALGIGGTLSYDVSPELLTGASVVEVTFGTVNLSFPESAYVYLGGSIVGGSFDMTGATLAGELFNDGTAIDGANTITAGLVGGASTFSIAIDSSEGFSLITLVDTTLDNFASKYDADKPSDGFDVGEFKVTSVVPLPAAAWMLLAGLGGLYGMRRLRKTS